MDKEKLAASTPVKRKPGRPFGTTKDKLPVKVNIPPVQLRTKFSQKKILTDIVLAFEKLGGVDFLVRTAEANPADFLRILAKVLPSNVQIDGEINNNITVTKIDYSNVGELTSKIIEGSVENELSCEEEQEIDEIIEKMDIDK